MLLRMLMPMTRAFDDRNAKDFDEITHRIEAALGRIEADKSYSTSQAELARLACVSRSTLHNRGWPIVRLNAIRQHRANQALIKEDERKIRDVPVVSDAEIIRNLMDQNTILLSRLFDASEEIDRLKRENSALNAMIAAADPGGGPSSGGQFASRIFPFKQSQK